MTLAELCNNLLKERARLILRIQAIDAELIQGHVLNAGNWNAELAVVEVLRVQSKTLPTPPRATRDGLPPLMPSAVKPMPTETPSRRTPPMTEQTVNDYLMTVGMSHSFEILDHFGVDRRAWQTLRRWAKDGHFTLDATGLYKPKIKKGTATVGV